MTSVGTVAGLYRYPVKSMQGEQVSAVDVTERGVTGDRAYALVDVTTGRIASAHRPDAWAPLLHCCARWESGGVAVTLPDGATFPIGTELEERLTALLKRPVRLVEQASHGAEYDFEVADVPDHAPQEFIDRMLGTATLPGSRIGRLRVALDAPKGTLVDVAPLHLLTTGSLAALARSGGDPDVRRFRPNILVDDGNGPGYSEGPLDRLEIRVGDATVRMTMPTMRCLMTTLEQRGVARDRATLAAVARDNRLRVGNGWWACLGHYANVTVGGRIRIGDALEATETP